MSKHTIEEKCDMSIKKIFGLPFYFTHSTQNIEEVLKSGKIRIGTNTKDKKWDDPLPKNI